MISGLIERDIRANMEDAEQELFDFSKPFVVIVSNAPILFPPASNLITLFDADQRFQFNNGLDIVYSLQVPVLNYSYAALMENLLNSPITIGKIRFEVLPRYNNVATPATISNFGAFQVYRKSNIGDADSGGIVLDIPLDQTYVNAVDFYTDIVLDGITTLRYNFPILIAGAMKITLWAKKQSSLSQAIADQKLFKSYSVPSTMLPVITEVELAK